MELRVLVLGPVEVWSDDTQLDLAPALRSLLAALVVDEGRVVSTDTLLRRLWEDEARAATMTTLHSYVSRLRRQVEPGSPGSPPQVLITRAPGYQLVLAPDAVDAAAFRSALRSARRDRDPGSARASVAHALSLWRGAAYADLTHSFITSEAARLHEQRNEALELAAELDLTLGRHRDVLEELADQVRRDPLREGLRASYMTALYRSGRQADALQAYEEGRHLLVESLGIDPGPELRRLHERVLRQDPALDAPISSGRPALDGAATTGRLPRAPHPSDASWETQPAGIGRAALVLPPTPLVGRDELLDELEDLVGSGVRLLTLTGTGGVGKTRLAVTLAHRLSEQFHDAVLLVPLATLQDPRLVLPTIARALGLVLTETPDGRSALAAQLAVQRVLLVLDNLEHLLGAAADVAWLVAACPRMVVVATSRAPLRVSGEHEQLVEPLATTLPHELRRPVGVREARASAAVALFEQRARSVVRHFVLTDHNAGDVVEICSRLGGIPLALELAAARLRIFGTHDLLVRLDEALASGPRDLPPRQRTMQATLDWSYRLLDHEAQGLFRRVSVFSGGWTLSLLLAVEGTDVTAALETLVEHSLVTVTWTNGEPRYSMLEPTLQHARRLVEDVEHAQAAAAHAAAYVAVAERAAAGYLAVSSWSGWRSWTSSTPTC